MPISRTSRTVAAAALAAVLAVVLFAPPASADTNARIANIKPAGFDFGKVAVGKTRAKSFTLRVDAGFGNVFVSGASAPFTVDLGACLGAVGPATCKGAITFTPTTNGAASNLVTITQCDLSSLCHDTPFGLAGVGTQKGSTTPTATLDFGNVHVFTTRTLSQVITVPAGFQLQGVAGTGLIAPFTFHPGNCAFFPGPGKCKMTEDYAPTASSGDVASLLFDVCPVVVGPPCLHPTFDAVGNGALVFAQKPLDLDFGKVRAGASKTKKVTVTLDAGFTVSAIGKGGDLGVDTVFGGTCTAATGPGHCTLAVTVTPPATGVLTGDVFVAECPTAGGTCENVRGTMTVTGT